MEVRRWAEATEATNSERSHCTVERPTRYRPFRRGRHVSRTRVGTQVVAPVALVGMGG